MMRPIAIILLTSLLLAPSGHAVDGPVVVVATAATGAGAATSSGSALALQMSAPSAQPLPHTWHLAAERVDIHVEQREYDSAAPGIAVQQTGGGRQHEGQHDAVVVSPMQAGSRAILFLAAPAASSTVEGPSLQWTHQPATSLEEEGILRPAEPIGVSFPPGMQPRISDGRIEVHGDLIIMVWDWDLHLTSSTGSIVVDSGYSRQAIVEGGPGRSYERQAYLYAHNATFTLQTQVPLMVHQDVERIEVEGTLDLHSVRTIRGLPVDSAKALSLQGTVRAELTPGEHGTQFALRGSWTEVRVDGQAMVMPQHSVPRGMYALAAGLAAAAALAAWSGRRRWQRHQIEELQADLDLGQYEQAVRRADRLLRGRRTRADAALLRATALLRSGQVEQAQAMLDRPWPGAKASWHYLKADAEALQGNWDAAAQHVQRCLEECPLFAVQIRRNRTLLPLLGGLPPVDAYAYQ